MIKVGNYEVKTSFEEIIAAKAAWGADRTNSRLLEGKTYKIEGSTTVVGGEGMDPWEGIVLTAEKSEPAIISINQLTGLYFLDGKACFVPKAKFATNTEVAKNTGTEVKVVGSERVKADKFGKPGEYVTKNFYTFE